MPASVERYLLAQPGVTHVSSFVGGGALRFLLVYSAEQPNTAYVQFLVEVDDWRKIDGLVPKIQKYLERELSERQRKRQEVHAGPGQRRTRPGAVQRPRSCHAARTCRPGAKHHRRQRRGRGRAQRLAST